MSVLDVIKFEGLSSREWIIYRHFKEKITSHSQLIVGEGQTAILVKSGTVCDIFQPGSYILDTRNIPILHGLVNLPYGGDTPYPVEIYFVNMTVKLDLYWGTTDPIQLVDPKYYVRLRIRAFGQYGIRITDCRTFFTELVGSLGPSAVSYDKVVDYYKGILVSKVKTIISSIILNDQISALEIAPRLEEISDKASSGIEPEFNKYGITIVNFKITSINFPNEDFAQINQILQDKAAFEIMGDSRYATKRSFDVYEGAANNEGGVAGAFVAGGIGLGAGAAMAGSVSSPVKPMGNMQSPQTSKCPSCGADVISGSKFCNVCGASMAPPVQHCPSCNSEVPAGSKFCNVCGASMTPALPEKKICECGSELAPGSRFCTSCGKAVEQ